MAALEDAAGYVTTPDDAWKRVRSRSLKPRYLGVLKQVAAWRESFAQQKNIPRNRVFRDETLIDIAANGPRTVAALARTRGISRGLAEGPAGQAILKAVERGRNGPAPEPLPDAVREDLPAGAAPVVEFLKVLLKERCEKGRVAQKLVASAADLERIAIDDGADVPALGGWRRTLFGEDALALKHGRLALAVRNGGIETIRLDEG